MFDTRAIPVRFHILRLLAQSPAHALHAMRTSVDEPTLSKTLGSGTHGMIFQPNLVIVYEGIRRGKAWDAFKAEHEGKIILNDREHRLARGIADSLLRHKEASRLLLDGTTVEQTIEWTLDGRACRGTPDARRSWLADLKTTRPMSPERFMRAAMWGGYVAQLSWYEDGIKLAGLPGVDECFLVVVENVAPYVVTVIRVPEKVLELGRRSIRLWWEQFRNCEASNEWPGYAQSTIDFVADDGEMPDLIFPSDVADEQGRVDTTQDW